MTDAEVESPTSWQQRALERSLGQARARALAHSSRFLAAAMELLQETGKVDFTVQNVIERSELSLRSFYQHFGGKDELVLALFEELMVQFVDDLRAEVDSIDDPMEQLEKFTHAFLSRTEQSRPVGGRPLTIYQLHLTVDEPENFARAFAPQIEFIEHMITRGVKAGAFRTDLPSEALTVLVHSTLMSIAQMELFEIHVTGSPVDPHHVWSWIRQAVSPPGRLQPVRVAAKRASARKVKSRG